MIVGSSINVYCSIYRKNEYPNIYKFHPLIEVFNKKYDVDEKIESVSLRCEEMFYLRMIRGNNIKFEDMWELTIYYTKKYDRIESLLKCEVDIDIRDDCGNTVLIWASLNGHHKIVSKLISARCELNIRDNYGDTALINASLNGHLEIVSKLISAGCELDIQNNNGDTVLIVASYFGYVEIVRELINAKCGLEIPDNYGDTALIWASYNGHLEIVKELISAGCGLDVQNKHKKTALDHVCRKKTSTNY